YIYIITGRPLNTRSMSKQWLKKYKVPYDYLLFSENKSAEVKNINFFIEDCREIAYNLAQKGITTILIDYPWNKPILEEPTLIKRVKCWQDIQMIFNNSITQRRKQL
ncbi:hypothetical protein, partial [Crocosphaera sp. Alani8]|uniref:hypothetical protein n=1 Tax=Crocosphaera sp. Alani8 TaxID=3038952 RepID=UPI00313C394A